MRVLIAEDDFETSEFLRSGLGELGHDAIVVADGKGALDLLLAQQFDAAVVDRLLPRLDGLSLVQQVRAAQIKTPVLLLTALGGIQDRVDGLEAGADDYLVKPFAFSELGARINALMRHVSLKPQATTLEHDGIVLDRLKRQVQRDGHPVSLQPREFRILEELMREEGKVVTRTMLLERVWNYHFDPNTNIVDSHISRLRSKLNEGGKRNAIETVRGSGYRMADHA